MSWPGTFIGSATRNGRRSNRICQLGGAGGVGWTTKVHAPTDEARRLRDWLTECGCDPVILPNPTRKQPRSYDKEGYRGRNVGERMFCRIKDFRRIATRCDKRTDVFPSAAILWWANWGPTLNRKVVLLHNLPDLAIKFLEARNGAIKSCHFVCI